ncbi:MAG: cytochrome c peroxidase [Candidatus Thiodiazotropha sp.]
MNATLRIGWLAMLLPLGIIPAAAQPDLETIERLGEALFFDVDLSRNRSQSCATCHAPDTAFVDTRVNASGQAYSLGDDGRSLGDRNAPTASYAALTPAFHKNRDGDYVGGLFLDGRAVDLAEQAGGPPLNPLEMGMPDKDAVVQRLWQNPAYREAFLRLFGEAVVNDTGAAYSAMSQSIAVFERSEKFAPFDSKYDRHLKGEYQMTAEEELGMTLFFSQQFTNCNLCHQLKPIPGSTRETFTNYTYHNIGVPTHRAGREANGLGAAYVDRGLLENPRVDDDEQAGRFKVPTLRNVAVTGPYMHNGVFRDLRTVVLFYNRYNSNSARRQINPESGLTWRDPEVKENLSLVELETGPALKDRQIDALVAFLQTLTDRRYEPLLDSGKEHP